MKYVELQEVCEIVNGATPSRRIKEYWEGDIDWFTPKDLSGLRTKYVFESPEKITLKGYNSCSTTLIPSGALLFTSRAPIGHLAITTKEVCTNQGFKTLVPDEGVNVEYLYYTLKKYTPNLKDLGNGATFKELSKTTVEKFKIPLPPLAQQKHIAQVLDSADTYRQKTKALIKKYEQLSQSLFLEMFGDPVTNPMGWEKVPTITYCNCLVPGRDKPKSFSGNVPWITTADLVHLGYTRVSRNQIGLTKNEIDEVRARLIPKTSVIMTCVGDLGVVSITASDIVMNQQLHAFICQDELNEVFLMYNLSYQTPYMYKMASSTTVPYMNKSVANNVPVIVPPNDLQTQFAQRIQAIEAQKALAEKELAKAEELFNSLLQKAFSPAGWHGKGDISV